MKLTRILMVLGVLLLAVGFVGVPVAMDATGADVITEFLCSSTTNGLGTTLLTDDTHAVQTPSGNVKMTCHFVVPMEYIPDQPTKNYEYLCSTPYGLTNDSYTIVDTEGYAMMRCQIKAPKE